MFVRGSTFRQSPRYRRRESLRGFDFEYFLNLLYRFYTPKGGFLFFVSSLSISYGYIPVNLCIYTYAFTGIYRESSTYKVIRLWGKKLLPPYGGSNRKKCDICVLTKNTHKCNI